MTSLLTGLAASVITQPSLVAVQTAVAQTTAPIPGFAASLQMITELLDRGRGIEAEYVARALLVRVESTMGRDVREVADVLDLLGRSCHGGGGMPDRRSTARRLRLRRGCPVVE